MKRSTIISTGAIVTGLAILTTGGIVAAQNSTTNPHDALISKISDKFHLNKSDVQKVFDEQRTEMEQHHQEQMKTRLDQAVKDGKITQEQEDKIIAKLNELQQSKPDFKNMTPQQRHDDMKSKRDEIEKWAKDNNIPIQYLRPGGMGHHGMGMMHDDGQQPDAQ